MKLVSESTKEEIKGELNELAEKLAQISAEGRDLSELYNPDVNARVPTFPDAEYVNLVESTGYVLMNDNGRKAAKKSVVDLGQRVWGKLLVLAQDSCEESD